MGSVKEDMLKRDPGVLQFQGTKSPRDQRSRKYSTLDLERTRLMALLTQGSVKLTLRFLMLSWVILRNVILLKLNSERWVELWPRVFHPPAGVYKVS